MKRSNLKGRKKGFFSPFRNKQCILNGLRRAAHEIWGDDATKLPSSTKAYSDVIELYEPVKRGRARIIYPSSPKILNHFSSMNHAWYAAGYLVETVIKQKTSDFITPEVDAKLREIYSYGRKGGRMPPGVPTVKAYAQTLGVGAHLLSQRAAKLGLVTPKEKPWTNAELKLLDRFGHLSPTIIWKRFRERGHKRTELAIALMRKRRAVHKGSPYYSVNALATLLGFDTHKITRDWLERFPNELKFEMKGTARSQGSRQNGDTKLIHANTIRDFIFNHPEEIDLHKVDKMWFLWLITKGRIKLVASSRIGKRAECYQPQLAREHRRAKRAANSLKAASEQATAGGTSFINIDRFREG